MKNEAHDIFISYSTDAESHLVVEMTRYFEGRDRMKVFVWERDSNMFGDSLARMLEDTIASCSHVFVLVTPKALESPWVKHEIDCARKYGKHLIPVYPDTINRAKLPIELGNPLGIEYKNAEGVQSQLARIGNGDAGWGCVAYIPAGGFGAVEFCASSPKAVCPIGERPMLFHVIDALVAPLFRKVVVINHKSHAPDFIRYLASLKYPGREEKIHDRHGREGFEGKVECVETRAGKWPQALKLMEPKDTFVLQLCDVILSFNTEGKTVSMEELEDCWVEAFEKHKQRRKNWGDKFLGTLLTCNYYRLSAGIVKVKRGAPHREVDNVEENPEAPTPLTMNTGTAILEPGILDFIEDGDASLLEGAVTRAREKGMRFVEYQWAHWSHVLNVNDWKLLHDKRVKILHEERVDVT